MDQWRNAVGRLHGLLRDYDVASPKHSTMRAAWAQVLDIPEGDVALELAKVSAELIPAATREVEASANEFIQETWGEIGPMWWAPLLHEGLSLGANPNEMQKPDLKILGMMWTNLLAQGDVDGAVPEQDQIDEWTTQLHDLRTKVQDDQTLDLHFREALARRLDDLMWSLKNLRRTGPAGVKDAVDRVLGSIVLQQAGSKAKISNTWTKVAAGLCLTIGAAVMQHYGDYKDNALEAAGDVTRAVEWVAGEWREIAPGELPVAPDEVDEPDEQSAA